MPERSALVEMIRRICIVSNADEVDSLVAELAEPKRTRIVAFVNAHAVNLAWHRPEIAQSFQTADILLRDGKGMDILMRRAGIAPGLNMNGTDFIPRVLQRARGEPVAIFGTSEPWLSTAGDILERDGHNVVDMCDGFRDDADYTAMAAESSATIIVLAMGMPKQERVASLIREARKDRPCSIICGGAIVDFLASRHPRAPRWMRENGMEWLFRFGREPRRLFSRYVIGNVQFVMRVQYLALQLTRGRSS